MTTPARRRARLVVGIVALSLCGACAAAALAAQSAAVRWVEHTLQVQQATSIWRADVLDAETGLRGFLLTGQPDFLEPYRRGVAREKADAAALHDLVGDNPAQIAEVEAADGAARQVLAGMTDLLAVADDHPRALSLFGLHEAKDRVDAFREAIARIDAEESRLLAQRVATERRVGVLSLAGGVVFALASVYVLAIAWRTRREADLSHALAEQQAAQLQFQERFVAVLGHDLRNPLNTIRMANQAVLRRHPAPEIADKIRRAELAARRMGRMIEQLLDFARARLAGGIPIAAKPGDVAHVVEAAVGEARDANPDRVIDVRASGSIEGRFDEDRLAQVFSNLLGNAIAHSASGTPIDVEVRGDGGSSVAVTVANDGEIPEELRATLFDPFRRGEKETKSPAAAGLGLGLYISNEIVRGHGGRIDVVSTDGKTCFTVRLPTRPAAR